MPINKDEPRDLKERLRHFHIEHENPLDWIPRDQPSRSPLSPGLTGITGWHHPGERWGLDKVNHRSPGSCRFCGTQMYWGEETTNAFVVYCPYPGCINNPDTPERKRQMMLEKLGKRKRLGGTKNITWDVF